MKKIKVHPGVVLLSVCDEHLLISTLEARKDLPYIQQINSAADYYWKLLEQDTDIKIIVDKAAEKFNMPKIKAFITVNNFINKLAETGYVTVQDVEEPK